LDGKVLFVVDPSLSLVFIDRLMGGQGDAPSHVRELTEIELVLLRRVIDRILFSLRDAWMNVVDVKPSIEQMEPSPHYVQLVPGSDTVITFTFSVSMRTAVGVIRFCVPFHMLKPLIPKLHEHLWFQDHEKPTDETVMLPEVRSHLMNTDIDMNVELGGADITVAELLDLQVGDCVVLDTLEADELPVQVAGHTRLWGRLGVVRRSYGISITRWEEDNPGAIADGNGGEKP
jgi:flagellar motor switch protein FliM